MDSRLAARLLVVAQAPDERGYRRQLLRGEFGSAHRGHWRAILFRLRHPFGDRFLDCRITAVAPQPFFVGEIRAERSTFSGVAVATDARSVADLPVIDLIAQCDHFRCDAFGQSAAADILVRSLRWFRGRSYDFFGGCRGAWARSYAAC